MYASSFAPEFRVQVGGQALPVDISKSILDVSVTESIEPATPGTARLTLANPYPELPWTHTEKIMLFEEGTELRVSLGYVDDLHLLFDGEITGMSPTFPESGHPTLRVDGTTLQHRLEGERKRRTFEKMSDKQIVEKIAAEAGYTPRVDAAGPTHEVMSQHDETDLEFLLRRAKAIGSELYFEGRTLCFTPPKHEEAPAYTLVWGRTHSSFRPGGDALPLASFTPSMDVRNQVAEVVVYGQDALTRETFEGRAGAAQDTPMGAQTGGQVAARVLGRTPTLEVKDVPVASQAEAEQLALARYRERARKFVSGSGATIGTPGLRPRTMVRVEGVGPRFEGLYYVSRATHSMGSGGYRTTFEVQRNAIG